MARFKNVYDYSLDVKNRLFIPAKFREELTESFILWTWFFAPCLYVLTEEEFDRLTARLEGEYSLMDEDIALVQRTLYSGACDVTVDKQGRILLPSYQREHAQITRDAVVVGAGNHVEIWSKENWYDPANKADPNRLREAIRSARLQGLL